MLRLKSTGHERLLQSPVLEATFGGGEANVAVSLANYGMPTGLVSVLPDNAIADVSWLHITGITPAVSASAAELSLSALQEAKAAGLKVSCDFR